MPNVIQIIFLLICAVFLAWTSVKFVLALRDRAKRKKAKEAQENIETEENK